MYFTATHRYTPGKNYLIISGNQKEDNVLSSLEFEYTEKACDI